MWMMGNYTPVVFTKAENPASVAKEFTTRLFTFVYLNTYNVWLLLCPYHLCCDWALDSIPLVTTMHDARWLLVLGVVVLLATTTGHSLAVVCATRTRLPSRVAWAVTNDDNNNNNNTNATTTTATNNTNTITTTNTTNNTNPNTNPNTNTTTNRNNKHHTTTNTTTITNDPLLSLLSVFGLLLMIIVFIPAMNIFFYVGFVIAERVLFLPSMGYSIW